MAWKCSFVMSWTLRLRQIVSGAKLSLENPAQQSVHLTGGILRHFRALSTPEQYPALEVLSTPAHTQVTQAVGWFSAQ
jgi:hypothetical protein